MSRLLQVLDASPFDHKMALGYLGAVSGMSQQTALEQMMRIEKNMGQHYKKLLVSLWASTALQEAAGEFCVRWPQPVVVYCNVFE